MPRRISSDGWHGRASLGRGCSRMAQQSRTVPPETQTYHLPTADLFPPAGHLPATTVATRRRISWSDMSTVDACTMRPAGGGPSALTLIFMQLVRLSGEVKPGRWKHGVSAAVRRNSCRPGHVSVDVGGIRACGNCTVRITCPPVAGRVLRGKVPGVCLTGTAPGAFLRGRRAGRCCPTEPCQLVSGLSTDRCQCTVSGLASRVIKC